VQAYVPTSGYIKPRATHNDTFCLRSDVNSVTDRLIELAWAGDHITEGRWKAERREELGNRRTHSKLLREYLVAVEANREDDLEELKERRLAAIRVRLIQNGWDEVDTQVIHPPLMRAWRQLVWQAKPLTDRIWNNLYPKLKPILEANKQQRLIREREHRRTTSHAQILGFLSNLKENECPYIELTAGSDGSALGSFERVRLPFPSIESIRKLSFLGTLWIEDITAEDTLTSLTSWRPKLEKAILSWRGGLERELVEKLTRGEFQLAFDSFTPSKQPLLKNKTITPSTASFTPDSEQYIHRDTKVLLRADSIFVISESDSVYFYPEAIDELEKKLADNPESRYKRKQNYGYDYEPNTIEQLDTSLLHIHYQAQEVARELLDRLGRPNATYLETKAIGQRFYQREGLQITSVNIHDLGEKEEVGDSMQVDGDETLNASKIAEQTPIEIVTVEDASSLLSTQLVPQLFGCQLCSLVPERFGEMGELPKGSKEVMEKHLTQEHPGTPEHTLKDGLYSV
ncbi:hypothetical protein FRC09_004923, partial [Ceratobasidium sp. 395]